MRADRAAAIVMFISVALLVWADRLQSERIARLEHAMIALAEIAKASGGKP